MSSPVRPVREALGRGALTGLCAGFAAGLIDALWSWGPAAQFVPGVLSRIRFVLYSGFSLALAGLLAGLVAAAGIVVLARFTRLGELAQFAWRVHVERRDRNPREALAGLSLALAMIPLLALALYAVYKGMTPIVLKSHAMGLAVLGVIAATLGALVVAIVLSFVLARAIELGLEAVVGSAPWLASPFAPLIAGGAIVAVGAAYWAQAQWETARLLPLHGPLVAVGAVILAAGAYRPMVVAARWMQWWMWPAKIVATVVLFFVLGGSAAVIKASTAFTGAGAPIARNVRRAFDWDHDGYARVLGGGDCDDSDPTVHPGAPEIPDDGIDQNCIGGDATTKPLVNDTAFAPVPATVPKDSNILLVTIDTTRADHLGMYGYKRATSPNLDKLAADGTVFEAGWAHAPSTRYSMPAILTGRLPLDVFYDTSVEGWPGLSQKATTLAEVLTPLGFISGAITNYWYFDRVRHMDQGFAEYDNENARLHNGVAGAGPEQTKGTSAREQTDKAIAFVQRHMSQKWFLWVHYYDPHYGYEPHASVKPFGVDAESMYDGEIAFTDQQIGRLLDTLRAQGLYDKTIVVVTGDHGEGFGEHGIKLHGYHLYGPQTKVPLIVRVPGIAPRRTKTAAGHIDIMPTLANLAGGQPNPDMMGRSLVDILGGKDVADRVVFQQLSYEGNHEMRAGVDARCHVIYNVSPDTSWEVYELDRDPAETRDVSGDPDACSSTRSTVERWYDREQIPPGAAEALLPSGAGLPAPLDAKFGAPQAARLLSVTASPAQAKPGEPVTLTWTWEADRRIDAKWRVFVHVKGPGSTAFINGDHKPVRPFEWWRPGQFIRYTTTVTLPQHTALGHYTVIAGVFAGSARMPTRSGSNNEVPVATFEVVAP